MENYEHNVLGQIWVVWKSNVSLSPVFKSDQMITSSVKIQGMREEFFFVLLFMRGIQQKKKMNFGKICVIIMILLCLEINLELSWEVSMKC